jgi:hypothetical protein
LTLEVHYFLPNEYVFKQDINAFTSEAMDRPTLLTFARSHIHFTISHALCTENTDIFVPTPYKVPTGSRSITFLELKLPAISEILSTALLKTEFWDVTLCHRGTIYPAQLRNVLEYLILRTAYHKIGQAVTNLKFNALSAE